MNAEAKKKLNEKIIIERERIVLREKSGFSLFSFIGFGCSFLFILIIVIVLGFTFFPEFRLKATEFGLGILADQFVNKQVPPVKLNPQLNFVNDIKEIEKTGVVVSEVKITQDEFNSYLEEYFNNITIPNTTEKVDTRILLKQDMMTIYIRIKDKKTPWLETYFNNIDGKVKFEKAILGPLTLDANSLKGTLSNLKLGIENVDFEQMDILLGSLILKENTKYKIDKIQINEGYMQVRLIQR